jgi:predicted RNA binding protein YcfA (HicA-like mRNA interferase family)
MKPRRLLNRLARGSLQNVSFGDFTTLVERFGFYSARVEGSHHIFVNDRIQQQLNLQAVRGEAKPYQIRQFLRIVEQYNLTFDDEGDTR